MECFVTFKQPEKRRIQKFKNINSGDMNWYQKMELRIQIFLRQLW